MDHSVGVGDVAEPRELDSRDMLGLAWNYFQLHSQQRVQFFNFFVVFVTLLSSAAIGFSESELGSSQWIGLTLGTVQVLVGWLFWKIDERNRLLIKHAERMIIQLESSIGSKAGSYPFRLFSDEENQTNEIYKDLTSKFPGKNQYSHGRSYMILFVLSITFGVLWMAMSINGMVSGRGKTKPLEIEVGVDPGVLQSFWWFKNESARLFYEVPQKANVAIEDKSGRIKK